MSDPVSARSFMSLAQELVDERLEQDSENHKLKEENKTLRAKTNYPDRDELLLQLREKDESIHLIKRDKAELLRRNAELVDNDKRMVHYASHADDVVREERTKVIELTGRQEVILGQLAIANGSRDLLRNEKLKIGARLDASAAENVKLQRVIHERDMMLNEASTLKVLLYAKLEGLEAALSATRTVCDSTAQIADLTRQLADQAAVIKREQAQVAVERSEVKSLKAVFSETGMALLGCQAKIDALQEGVSKAARGARSILTGLGNPVA
jgi:hypothetical protein